MGDAISGTLGSIGTGASNVWNSLPSFASSPAASAPPTTGLTDTSIAGGTTPAAPLALPAAPSLTPTPATAPAGDPSNLPIGGSTNPALAGTPPPESSTTPSSGTAAPAAPAPTNWGGDLKTGGTLLGAVATALQAYQRYNLSQNLQDPSYVANQIKKLTIPLSANLKNSVGSGVQAQMQEAGLGEAPGLFRQALAQALAPYQLQQQQSAEQEYLQSINASNSEENSMGSDLSSFSKSLQDLYS